MAGKFNLNQILSDTSRAAAGGGDIKPRPAESRFERLSVFDLVPSEDNFYSMREIEELKAAIEIAGKVLQNLVVVPLESGKYKVIAGHRRRLASIGLVEDGKPQYEFVPCDIEPNEEAAEDQEIRDGLTLIVTNSQREKTAWDKIEEVRYLREVLEKARTNPRFVGVLRQIVVTVFGDAGVQADGTRDFLAKVLHTAPSQIGRYDAIIRHLCPEFKAELKEDRINISTAYELSGLEPEDQQAAFAEYQRTGEISIKTARERKKERESEVFHCKEHEECEYNAQDVCALADGMECPHGMNPRGQYAQPPAAAEVMESDPPASGPENPPTPPAEEPTEETPPRPASLPSAAAVPEEQPDEEPREEAYKPPEPPAESGFRQQDPPEPQEAEEPPAPPSAAPPAQQNEAEERARMVLQLQSLRDYCEAMHESDTDGGSRVWALDADALDYAICALNKG